MAQQSLWDMVMIMEMSPELSDAKRLEFIFDVLNSERAAMAAEMTAREHRSHIAKLFTAASKGKEARAV